MDALNLVASKLKSPFEPRAKSTKSPAFSAMVGMFVVVPLPFAKVCEKTELPLTMIWPEAPLPP
jgi:hypothetical protein